MNKILFVIPSFSGGGAERVLINILKHIDRKSFEPLLVTFTSRNDYKNDMPRDIKHICLDEKNILDSFRLVFKLSEIIKKEKPSLILSFLSRSNYITLASAKISKTKTPVIISERNTLSKSLSSTKLGFLKRMLTNLLYRYAAAVIAVSRGVKEDLCKNFKVSKDKCRVIYNPVNIEKINSMSSEAINYPLYTNNIPIISACGRLITQKNYPPSLKSNGKSS